MPHSILAGRLVAACLASALFATPALAAIEGDYNQDTAGPPNTTWYIPANPDALKADRDYVDGMRPHHAGALAMSRDYLADPEASSPVLRALARAIIRNQTFEIRMLDAVDAKLRQPPVEINLGFTKLRLQAAADEGLAQRERFLRAPMPTRLDGLSDPRAPVSARDVRYAKGMILHHQAALDMARAYHANPAARNGFLGLLNIDIDRDQTQEIGLMRAMIRQYGGDPDSIVVDPATIPGMAGMHHGPAAPPPGPEAGTAGHAGGQHGAARH